MFEKALELWPDYADAHACRGIILANLGKCDEAAAEVLKAVELSPWGTMDNPKWIAEAHLAHFYYHCPDHYDLAEALRHAQTAYVDWPFDTWAQEIQALALLRNEDYTEAKRIYLDLFEIRPDGTSWFPLAMCLWHLGEKDEARRFHDRSVVWMDERVPDSPMYNNLRQEAAEVLGIQP